MKVLIKNTSPDREFWKARWEGSTPDPDEAHRYDIDYALQIQAECEPGDCVPIITDEHGVPLDQSVLDEAKADLAERQRAVAMEEEVANLIERRPNT